MSAFWSPSKLYLTLPPAVIIGGAAGLGFILIAVSSFGATKANNEDAPTASFSPKVGGFAMPIGISGSAKRIDSGERRVAAKTEISVIPEPELETTNGSGGAEIGGSVRIEAFAFAVRIGPVNRTCASKAKIKNMLTTLEMPVLIKKKPAEEIKSI